MSRKVIRVEDYQKLYTLLFNGITDAIEQIDQKNYGRARDILVDAQIRAEEQFLSEEDEK